ncbi:autotransporter outer membrane beta-barrel domain-containing protein [Bradyrhizobium sp. SSUT18]|uniref:autotransporter outer membrane beta-barrel domain-containing protein n=1 Tax=Bradyrhizobium sp. SSUT18 TaxID=3040602 RepID=UPI00244D051B|nr:autotransporter outer membrane beta-barrel domain-containing protein [Bradyrhizobium sp. SSUT18]MDH2402039.1 autotransporter outer membrane beta-barrel domain-containing protein [Bradyrhizobium sp. SSUT18]
MITRRCARFATNWLAGAEEGGRSLRRRLMMVLRRAHQSLGLRRDRLGLGALGIGGVALTLARSGILVALLGLAATPAHAIDYFWDINGATAGAGGTTPSGTWSAGGTTLSTSSTGTTATGAVTTTTADRLFFSAGTDATGAYTVTVNGTQNINSLIFQEGTATLTGGTLTLGGATPTITNTASATISSVIAGTAGLTKAGAGTLTLSGANTFSGGIDVNAGTLNVTADAALGAAANGITLANGTQLGNTTNSALLASRLVTLTSGSATVTGRVGAARYTGAGGLNVLGTGSAFNNVTLSNNANDYTGQTRFTGTGGTHSFSSVGDLGVASALGAPTTVANGTILVALTSGVSTIAYTGTGDSSNRNWTFQASGAGGADTRLRNSGSGTLTLTGAITLTGSNTATSNFDAVSGDLALLGAITDGVLIRAVSFTGAAGRTITLGGANDWGSVTSISGGVTVVAPVLANLGVASSIGAGNGGINQVGINGGSILSYTGAGASSNRGWSLTSGTLRNNGSGALTLSGAVALPGAGTLGGSFTGVNSLSGVISGVGALAVNTAGTWALTAANTYTGGTTISAGTLQLGNGGTSGSIVGNVVDNGVLVFNRSDAVTFGGLISGTGVVNQIGSGTTVLTAANSYGGPTTISAGSLIVNGDQTAATGLTAVNNGGALGGNGVIGGSVAVANGGTLAPGNTGGVPGTLTIQQNLALSSGSALNYNFGQANVVGGALNDLTKVNGNLTLDGTLNVTVSPGGTFDPGIYRAISYNGSLTNNGLQVGTIPSPDFFVQTSIANQVNLVNTAGLTLNFWDGAAGPRNNGVVNGGNGIWQNSAGNDNWTTGTGTVNAPFTDAAFAIFAGIGGTVTVDNSLGQVTAAGMQFAADGYHLTGGAIALSGSPTSIIRVGDGTLTGASFIATIDNVLSGNTQLVKTDLGTLVLTGANTYTGGTAVQGGTLRISSDANLGAASGGVTLDSGTLQTTASIASNRLVSLPGTGTFLTDSATTLTLNGTLTGAGGFVKDGTGTLLLNGAATNAGSTTVAAGTLQAGAANVFSAASAFSVLSGGALDLNGHDQTVASLGNAGTVSLNGAPGTTLTVTGDYVGGNGLLRLNTALGSDASVTDRLVVQGSTLGATALRVANVGGTGAPTVEGIKVVDVGGASNGIFALQGNYVIQGQQAVVGGAYAYTLQKNGVSTPTDGDWYLRSSLVNPPPPAAPPGPLYQPGVPLYENYAQVLLGLNELPTLQQRVGNRYWGGSDAMARAGIAPVPGDGSPAPSAFWGRIEGRRADLQPSNTTGSTYTADQMKLQAGLDGVVLENERGRLIVGLTAQYGLTTANVASFFGNGRIRVEGAGVGGTLTWYGDNGFYVDGQAQSMFYHSDLSSVLVGSLTHGNEGLGYAFSVETGRRIAVGNGWSLTPQAQLAYSKVDFDSFADRFGARVSLRDNDSLVGRAGLALSHQKTWNDGSGITRSDVYGMANVHYGFLNGTSVDVAGTGFASAQDRLWGSIGGGGTYSWANGRYAIFGEVSYNASLAGSSDSHSYKGTGGFRIVW